MQPWLAGALIAFSSVSVVLNALRLQKSKSKNITKRNAMMRSFLLVNVDICLCFFKI